MKDIDKGVKEESITGKGKKVKSGNPKRCHRGEVNTGFG